MLNDLSTLTNEVWSMIAEFPDYQVSNHGRVKHIYRNGREYILRPWLDRYGYPTAHIHRTTQRSSTGSVILYPQSMEFT